MEGLCEEPQADILPRPIRQPATGPDGDVQVRDASRLRPRT